MAADPSAEAVARRFLARQPLVDEYESDPENAAAIAGAAFARLVRQVRAADAMICRELAAKGRTADVRLGASVCRDRIRAQNRPRPRRRGEPR